MWTKLAAWRLTEFERVVFLDADMLVVQNMDELFALDLAAGHHRRLPRVPLQPQPDRELPRELDAGELLLHHSRPEHTPSPATDDYLNGGLLVLTPGRGGVRRHAAAVGRRDDLSRYPFAEQDFLNEYYLRTAGSRCPTSTTR